MSIDKALNPADMAGMNSLSTLMADLRQLEALKFNANVGNHE